MTKEEIRSFEKKVQAAIGWGLLALSPIIGIILIVIKYKI
jgi:hypothetical protein